MTPVEGTWQQVGSTGDLSQGEQPTHTEPPPHAEQAVATRNHQRPLRKKCEESESGRIRRESQKDLPTQGEGMVESKRRGSS